MAQERQSGVGDDLPDAGRDGRVVRDAAGEPDRPQPPALRGVDGDACEAVGEEPLSGGGDVGGRVPLGQLRESLERAVGPEDGLLAGPVDGRVDWTRLATDGSRLQTERRLAAVRPLRTEAQ